MRADAMSMPQCGALHQAGQSNTTLDAGVRIALCVQAMLLFPADRYRGAVDAFIQPAAFDGILVPFFPSPNAENTGLVSPF